MRIILNFIFTISLLFPLNLYAEIPVLFSDVSAGVFRFQIKLAEQGNPEAQYKVGEMYEMGKGVPKDAQEALTWYEKSAAQGHKKSGYKLLFLEIKTNGLNDFNKTQLGVLRQEAAGGNSDAQYFLGKMYATGIGVPKSLDNALTWLNKATFNGVPEAEHEAIAVEEELARIREKQAKKRAAALEASQRKQAEEEKLKAQQAKDAEKKRKADAAKRKSAKDAEARRLAEERRRLEAEKAALAAEKARLQKARQSQPAQAAPQPSASKPEEAEFESDPCKGKSARFLSTCR